MCGIVGVAVCRGFRPGLDAAGVSRLRDRMRHRGPDDAGVWDGGHVILGHRRLAVVDPSVAGHQPMTAGSHAIVYNGELYNDAVLRAELCREGATFRSSCDAETVLRALATWGDSALGAFRGMFALGWFDGRRLVLARDWLGIKPLYWWVGEVGCRTEVVFASEIGPILAHPGVRIEPDFAAISAYVTTIRTTLGERTLFAGVRTVRPGQVIEFDLSRADGSVGITRRSLGETGSCGVTTAGLQRHCGEVIDTQEECASGVPKGGRDSRPTGSEWIVRMPGDGREFGVAAGMIAAARVRAYVEESVRAHLRSDVSLCCLLSGGLDSSIIASIAHRACGGLRTFWAGAAEEDAATGDRAMARLMAARLGTDHVEVEVTEPQFLERWREMVEAMRAPLSTPNEVAINAVCRRMRGEGEVVTLSGEGADELFGGYEGPMRAAAAFEEALGRVRLPAEALVRRRALFQIESNAWVSPTGKGGVIREDVWRGIERDAAMLAEYESEFARVAGEREDDSPVQAHLRFYRRINLAGLLLRLDSASMLASIEGRTPYADVVVRDLAESLAMEEKFQGEGGGIARTKIVLREAFGADLPREIVERTKASFPLPFAAWMGGVGVGEWLRGSGFAREVFSEEAIEAAARSPGETWAMSWPMVNVALWGDGVWGSQALL